MRTVALDEELVDLAALLDEVARDIADDDVIHAAVNAPSQPTPEVFGRLAKLGVLGLALPEERGGSGVGLMGLATAAEALGRRLVPGPTLPTAITALVLERAGKHDVAGKLVEGGVVGATAYGPGTVTFTADGTLTGRTAPVIAGGDVDSLVLPVMGDAGRTWVLVDAADARMRVIEHPSYDLTRRLQSFDLTGASADVLDVDVDLPVHVAVVVLGAESVGIADWCTHTAAEYATTREQFGRPIGQFQAVKHRIARMLVATEQARALVWDAARCLDGHEDATPDDRESAALVVSSAGAICLDAGLETAKDLVNTLAGIGFTWEHLAGFYLRRAHTTRVALGSSQLWSSAAGRLALGGANRQPSPGLPPGAEETRAAVRAELDQAMAMQVDERRTFLADHGYTMPTLPKPWGKNADALMQVVVAEELTTSDLTPPDMVIGNWVLPSIVGFGTDEQTERFVRPSLRGQIQWCQLFSEPGAGSDLAGLRTRAEKVDGGWKINGQKVWTSGARESQWGILLARTDPSAPKHKGIGYFLLDMDSPGITIRPLRELTGEALFNEIFLDDVFIPDELLVGEPTQGWRIAVNTLANERVHMTGHSVFGQGEATLLQAVHDTGKADDPLTQHEVGRLLGRSLSSSFLGARSLVKSLAGAQPGAESSVGKFISTQNIQDTWQAVLDVTGLDGLTSEYLRDELTVEQKAKIAAHMFLNSRALTIAGGTTDVQLNIIAERILGLPRD